jgi:hypothetical protein
MNHKLATAPIGAPSGHPFRRTLPAHVLAPLPELEPEVRAAMERRDRERELALFAWDKVVSPFEAALIAPAAAQVEPRRRLFTAHDVRQFVLAYVACFAAVSVFIS